MTREVFVDLVESLGGTVSFQTCLIGRHAYPYLVIALGEASWRGEAPTVRAVIRRALSWVQQVAHERDQKEIR